MGIFDSIKGLFSGAKTESFDEKVGDKGEYHEYGNVYEVELVFVERDAKGTKYLFKVLNVVNQTTMKKRRGEVIGPVFKANGAGDVGWDFTKFSN